MAKIMQKMVGRCALLVLLVAFIRFITTTNLLFTTKIPASIPMIDAKEESKQEERYLRVPQIVWGLNNQKIAVARAALTARSLNRTLLIPNLTASLFFKEKEVVRTNSLSFDKIFSLQKFNSMCHGFVQMSSGFDTQAEDDFVVVKGSGRRWTKERDWAQILQHRNTKHRVIRIQGKNPFLWHDHWPVTDYAKVFQCMVLLDSISYDVSKVVNKLRNNIHKKYVAVHMRIEIDWAIHCKNLEARAFSHQGQNLSICASKQQIIERVSQIQEIPKPSVVYLAVADELLDANEGVLKGWGDGFEAVEKKKLGVIENVYKKHSYLVQAAIDYEVCLQSDIFVGNSYSTFSSLVVLQRSLRRSEFLLQSGCAGINYLSSYSYNIVDSHGRAKRWDTNMSEPTLQSISYGSNHVTDFFSGSCSVRQNA